MRLDIADTGFLSVPGSHGMNVPSTCTIIIIAGKYRQLKRIYKIALTMYASNLQVRAPKRGPKEKA